MQYNAIPCIINNCWRSVPLPCGQYMAIFNGVLLVVQNIERFYAVFGSLFVIYVSVPVSWLSYKSPILELPIKKDFPNQPCRTQIKLSAFGIQKIVQNATNKSPVPGRKRLFLPGKIFQGFKSMSVHALSWKCHLLFRLCKHLLNWVSQHQKLWLTFSKLVVRDNSE